jgi:predicted Zn-dependent protease
MVRWPLTLVVCFFVSALSLGVGCSSVPAGKDGASQAALLSEPPAEFVNQIELAFRRRVAFIENQSIETYLSRVAGRLLPPGKNKIQIALVSTTNAGFDPSVWAVPGGKIFFDVRVLRGLHFENEIASALAFAWERSAGTEFRERLIEEASHADPDPMKVWTFGTVESERAIESAVDRLYKAGYDPRGLVNYFERIPSKSKNQLESENEALKDKARRTISFYAPLLNPIVRTEDFYKMRKRLEHL